MKKIIIPIAALVITTLYMLPAFSQAPHIMELNNEAFESDQRPPAVFEHDQHNIDAELEDKCWLCHHMDGANPSEDQSSEGFPCADCHPVENPGATNLMDAYHRQCIDCHDEKNEGPVACGECHMK